MTQILSTVFLLFLGIFFSTPCLKEVPVLPTTNLLIPDVISSAKKVNIDPKGMIVLFEGFMTGKQ